MSQLFKTWFEFDINKARGGNHDNAASCSKVFSNRTFPTFQFFYLRVSRETFTKGWKYLINIFGCKLRKIIFLCNFFHKTLCFVFVVFALVVTAWCSVYSQFFAWELCRQKLVKEHVYLMPSYTIYLINR